MQQCRSVISIKLRSNFIKKQIFSNGHLWMTASKYTEMSKSDMLWRYLKKQQVSNDWIPGI